jgi:uncharacterized protein (DUF697 family)
LPDEGRQRTLLAHALLTGLTALIPVPLADDLAKSHMRRRLVRLLAQAHGRELSEGTLEALAREPGRGGCLGGCLAQAFTYPLKKIFRKVFFVLEWKRAVDLTSYTYHWGYLLDYALQEGLVGSAAAGQNARPSVEELRAALEAACRETPTQPVEGAVRATLRQSRAALLSAARRMQAGLSRGAGRADEPAAGAGEPAPEPEGALSQVSGVAARLQQRIASGVPEAHFRELRDRFRAHLSGRTSRGG